MQWEGVKKALKCAYVIYEWFHSNRQLLDNFRGNNELPVKKEELENDCWDNSFDYVSYDQDVSTKNSGLTMTFTLYSSEISNLF